MTSSSTTSGSPATLDLIDLCLYHGGCGDGFGAAWVVHRRFPNCEFVPIAVGVTNPPDCTGRNVLVVDVSFPREDIIRMANEAETFFLLDHHVSAKRELEDLYYTYFDMNRSGAGLAWDFFGAHEDGKPGTQRPLLIDVIEDTDLYRSKVPHSSAIRSVLESQPQTFTDWTGFSKYLDVSVETRKGIIDHGYAILQARHAFVNRICSQAHPIWVDGRKVWAVNTPLLMSEAATRLAKNAAFAVAWSLTKDGTVKVSLRSDYDGDDVSIIATKYGGGGHKRAAGFTIGLLQFIALINPRDVPASALAVYTSPALSLDEESYADWRSRLLDPIE